MKVSISMQIAVTMMIALAVGMLLAAERIRHAAEIRGTSDPSAVDLYGPPAMPEITMVMSADGSVAVLRCGKQFCVLVRNGKGLYDRARRLPDAFLVFSDSKQAWVNP